MDRRWLAGNSLWILTSLFATSMGAAADSQPVEHHKGVTVDDLTRGVRGAARNIEQEIPKIGPAVGKTLKSIGGQGSNKTHTPQSTPARK